MGVLAENEMLKWVLTIFFIVLKVNATDRLKENCPSPDGLKDAGGMTANAVVITSAI